MANPSKKKLVNLFYRRATFGDRKKANLEKLMKLAHEKFPSSSLRTFSGGFGTEIQGANFDHHPSFGIRLHIAKYVPDQSASIISKPSKSLSSQTGEATPPDGHDFLTGDIFVLIKNNDVLLCPSGVRDAVALRYIFEMLTKCKRDNLASLFDLEKIAKADKVKMIQDQGVKAIELDSSLYLASMHDIEEKEKGKKIRKETKISDIPVILIDHLIALFEKDKDLNHISEKENLNVKLIVSFDGREARTRTKEDSDFGKTGKKRLSEVSKKILLESDDDTSIDGFKIITNGGTTITHEEIQITKKYKIEKLGNSINLDSAWSCLKDWYSQLEKTGILSQ